MPWRSRASIESIRSTERLKPIARRSSSASPPVKPAATIAMLQDLLLEERDAERALQDRLEAGVRVLDLRPALPPLEERAHHAADDAARAG